ncbi:MAG: histidine phosphatase family protein [Sedimenticola sp.]|jgi:alpha-ribazole phosphatase/probable phosphoglycerate mutase|nr:MAG: histidine phosphatase family protein [Sedimenticola sp.]
MTDSTLIDLLRHGTPEGGRRYRGRQDDPLSEEGWQQMWHAASGETPWSQVISSPLSRCRAFSEQLADKLSLPLTIDVRFQELGYGVWEGKSADQLKADDPDILKRFFYDPHTHRPPDAEPVVDFMQRVGEAYSEAVANHAGQHILIVAHACVIRAIIAKVLNAPPEAVFRMHVETAHLSRIRESSERPPTLMFHGQARL